MKAWMTAADIAAEKLPGLPTTKMGVSAMAKREGWDCHPAFARARQGRGGGFEYSVRILPTLAQVELMQRSMVVGVPVAAEPAGSDIDVGLSGRAARERDARLAIVAAFDDLVKGLPKLRHSSHLQIFMDKYNARTLRIEGWVTDLIPTISKRSIDRWRAAKRDGSTKALAVDRGQARKGTGVLDVANEGKVRTAILTLLAQNAHFSAAHIRDQVESLFGDQLWVPYKGAAAGMTKSVPVPPVRTFQAFIKALKADHKVVLTKLTDPDRYRSTMAPSGVGSLRHIAQPNQLWQIDASPVDALCTDGRHSMYACVDIYSRRSIVLISKTPRASAVALLLRKAIMAWGVPSTIKTDNGSDFVAQDSKRLLISLDIEQDISDAYSPEQKGHVERFIRTFQHDFATLLPGFVGHNVADRKAIENRKSFAQRLGQSDAETFDVSLSGLELQRLADKWVSTMYEQREHHGLQGLTPIQKWNSANYRPRTVDVRALDLLLMPVAGKNGIRTTTKFGIRIDGYHYATPNLLPGHTVLVRQDPEDLGRVFAFEPDGGRYLGEGMCPELAGVHPATFMKAVRDLHREAIDEVANPVRKMLRQLAKGPAPIERALQLAAERDQDNVVSLGGTIEAHSTQQVDAALAAMDTIAGNAPRAALDEATAAEHRRMVALFRSEEAAEEAAAVESSIASVEAMESVLHRSVVVDEDRNVTTIETPKSRYVRAVRLREAYEAGKTVPTEQAVWLGQYETTDEFRGHKAVHEDFGDDYLT